MKPSFRNVLFAVWACCLGNVLWGQQAYRTADQLAATIRQWEQQYPDRLQVRSLGQSPAGHDIRVLVIGAGNPDARPAIAVVGGVYGPHLAGQALAMQVAEELLLAGATEEGKALLEKTSFYILPQVAPDAAQQYFADLQYERAGNAHPTDDDRDGRLDEDPFDDLDGNGLITMMRVADPTGKYVPHPADERVLIEADPKAGQSGQYLLITEGLDNDRDGHFNEDGPGGVAFNKNLTFQHPSFQPNAGEFPVSEPETRAVLDFLYERFNIFAVLTFGPTDNLAAPWTFAPSNQRGRRVNGILRQDAVVNQWVSDLFREAVKVPKGQKSSLQGGGFAEWAYFHYGRYSFSTPGWYVPEWKMPQDSTAKARYKANEDKNPDVNFLRWAEDEGLENVFVPWKAIDHPDFPGRKVEVGGIAPFAQLNPPADRIADLGKAHAGFLKALAARQPSVALSNVSKEEVSKGLYRVKATLHNTGMLATATEIGDQINWVKRLKVTLTTTDGQQILSGQAHQLIPRMEGNTGMEMTWLIRGNGPVTIAAEAPQCGVASATLQLQ